MVLGVPELSDGDRARRLIEALGKLLPGGSTIGDLLRIVWESGYSRQSREWQASVASALVDLYNRQPFDLERLLADREFFGTFCQATLIAIQSANERKLAALRAAVVNTAAGMSPGEAKRVMFLSLIERFSEWHLVLLTLCSAEAFRRAETRGKQKSTDEETAAFNQFIRDVESSLEPLLNERVFHRQVLRELQAAGLVQGSNQQVREVGRPGWQIQLGSSLGLEFLRFVTPSPLTGTRLESR